MYDASVRSDLASVERVQEAVREQLFRRLNKELPYVIQLHVVSWADLPDGGAHVTVDISVERAAHAVRFAQPPGLPHRRETDDGGRSHRQGPCPGILLGHRRGCERQRHQDRRREMQRCSHALLRPAHAPGASRQAVSLAHLAIVNDRIFYSDRAPQVGIGAVYSFPKIAPPSFVTTLRLGVRT